MAASSFLRTLMVSVWNTICSLLSLVSRPIICRTEALGQPLLEFPRGVDPDVVVSRNHLRSSDWHTMRETDRIGCT